MGHTVGLYDVRVSISYTLLGHAAQMEISLHLNNIYPS